MNGELSAIAGGRLLGRILCARGRMQFRYDPAWQSFRGAHPLSLSMPQQVAEHPHAAIDPFLRGLLPDNPTTLRHWASRFHVSAGDPFELLWHVGEDCAGAVQFVPREREADLLGREPHGAIDWLTEDGLAERVRLLLADHSNTRTADDSGQFSLAGAQPKLAFYRDPQDGRWGVPSGRTPTTHILKPASDRRFDGHAENEHFCLELARRLGLLVPASEIIHPGGQPVIVVTRYDRMFTADGHCLRVHQEDMCQALSIPPEGKYQNQCGPSARDIAGLLADSSSEPREDIRRFADALAFNWLIAGTDAHAKNYSLLIAGGNQVLLAPFYDLASILPYPRVCHPKKAKLAMKIGSEYLFHKITRRHWTDCAREMRMPAVEMLERVVSMAERLPGLAVETAQALHEEGLEHPVIGEMVEKLREHAGECGGRLVG